MIVKYSNLRDQDSQSFGEKIVLLNLYLTIQSGIAEKKKLDHFDVLKRFHNILKSENVREI